jgi:hypothetical protein
MPFDLKGFVMGVIAVNHVRRNEPMQKPRYHLDASKATHITAHHDEACRTSRYSALDEVVHGFWQHAVQGGEYLENISTWHAITHPGRKTDHHAEAEGERTCQESVTVLDVEVLGFRKLLKEHVQVYYAGTRDTGCGKG